MTIDPRFDPRTGIVPMRVRWGLARGRGPAGDAESAPAGSPPAQRTGQRIGEGTPGGIVPVDRARPWRAPAPAALPDLRARLLAHTRSTVFAREIAASVDAGRASILPTVPDAGEHGTGQVAARLLQRLECDRLETARLYHVSGDMTALACAVGEKPPNETVRPSRLPAPTGFMVFDSPIGAYAQDLVPALRQSSILEPVQERLMTVRPIVAAAWSHWSPRSIGVGAPGRELPVRWWLNGADGVEPIPGDRAGAWLTLYALSDGSDWAAYDPGLPVARSRTDGALITAGDLAAHRTGGGLNIAWDNELVLSWGAPFDPDPPSNSAQKWGQIVYTAWQLITQKSGKRPIADIEELPRNRAGRKRDERAGIADGSVRIVDVHAPLRPSRAARDADEAAGDGRKPPHYTCRWPVPPYRRYTCLNPRRHEAGECDHEDRVVGFSIRGPEGAPLRVRERVDVWDHMPED